MWPRNVEGRDEEEERARAEVQQRCGRGFKEQSRQHFLIGINPFWEFEILLPCLVPFFIDLWIFKTMDFGLDFGIKISRFHLLCSTLLSHTILESEAACVNLEDLERIQAWRQLTLLFYGWEDILWRNLYGTVGAGIGKFPIMLSLDNMTGRRGTAQGYLETIKGAMHKMGITGGLGLCTVTHPRCTDGTVCTGAVPGLVESGPWIHHTRHLL